MKSWLCLKLVETINVGGVERKADNEHMVGVAPVFDDHDIALDFVHGNEYALMQVDIEEPNKCPSAPPFLHAFTLIMVT